MSGEQNVIRRWRSLVGARSESVVNVVEKGTVRKFAEAIDDMNPLYVDEEMAKSSRYGALLAPPTFPRTFEYGKIEGMVWPESGMIHGEHRIHCERPLRVGEEVYCSTELKDYYEKEGSDGILGFLVLERIGLSPLGERIYTIEDTAIVNPSLRRSLKE